MVGWVSCDYFDTVTNTSILQKATDADMDAIAKLDHVDTLILEPRGLADHGLAQVDKMTGLRWLTISGIDVNMDTRILPLQSITRVQGLNADGTDITDAGMRHMSDRSCLELLSLTQTKITDAGLAQLKGMSGLKHLFLDGTQVGDAGLCIWSDSSISKV